MTALRPRIFISHSAKDRAAAALLEALEHTLQENGFDVFVDRTRLLPGSVWSKEIYTFIALCHGAIVLLSETALESPWVQAEVATLNPRRVADPESFLIVPVLVDPVTDADLETGALAPFELARLQAVKHATADDVPRIIERFLALRDRFRDTPFDRLAAVVVHEMPEDAPLLESAAREMGVTLKDVQPDRAARAVAMAFFHVGLEKVEDGLRLLAQRMSKTGATKVVKVVVPFWVDAVAVAPLIRATLSPPPRPVSLLNASREWTARQYIHRAEGRYPFTWHIIPITGAGGEHTAGTVISEIRDYFRKRADEPVDDDWIDRRIAGSKDKVMVVMPPTIRIETIAAVRRKYPHCVCLALTGRHVPKPERFEDLDAVVLTPALQDDQEEAAYDLSEACHRIPETMI